MSTQPEAQRLAEFCEGNVLYQPAAAELRRLSAENERIGPLAERVLELKAQRDALLEALSAMLEQFNYNTITGIVHDESAAINKARAAIKAVEGEKT